jgi:hypothetical protein
MPDEQVGRRDQTAHASSHRKPRDGNNGSPPPETVNPTRARAGQVLRAGLMRRVLVISLALIIVAFALIYLIFFFTQPEEEAAEPPQAPAEEEMEPPLPPTE